MKDKFTEQLASYKENGFAIFPQLFDEDLMHKWREKHKQLVEEYGKWWFGNMLEYAPKFLWPAVTHPTLLDFAEQVMGPFVQLDNLTLAAFPPVPKENAVRKVSGWHRDRWGQVPRSDVYESPNAMNAICYLQDLTDEFGPLRVIAGSHRRSITMTPEERTEPHPEETIFRMRAGDVIFTHNNVVHSGTPNTSGQMRYFFSIYYNLTWLKHTDNHSGPLTQQLLAEARARNDQRFMRLLGVDEQLQPRCNSGFLIPDEERWAEWAAADRAAIKKPSA